MKQSIIIGAALVAGFLGGTIGAYIATPAKDDSRQIIRAQRFELIDAAGHPISFWGVDKLNNAVLAFGSRGLASGSVHWVGQSRDLRDPEGQLMTIGLSSGDDAMLLMNGADGKTRVNLALDPNAKPVLMMEDEYGPKMWLGIALSDTPGPGDNNWALQFAENRAWLGVITQSLDGHRYVRGLLDVNKEKTKLPLP